MWLKLGEKEIINLDHVYSVKKGFEGDVLELHFVVGNQKRVLPFDSENLRDAAFDRIMKNLQKLGKGLE